MRRNNDFKRGRKTVAVSSVTPPKTEKLTKTISKADREVELAETSEESYGSCCHHEQGALNRDIAQHSDVSECGSKIEEVEECTSDMPSTKRVRGTVLALAWALEGQHITPTNLTARAEGDDISFGVREKSDYPGEPDIEWYPKNQKTSVVSMDMSDCVVDMDTSSVEENTPSGIADMEISSCYVGDEAITMAKVQVELGPTIDQLIEMQRVEIMTARKETRCSKRSSRKTHTENVNPNTNKQRPALPKPNFKMTKKNGKHTQPAPRMLPKGMSKMR